MARYIFITGGVVSSLGKGLASAALGACLQARGYTVRLRKLDPYLNVDPGTMSPYQHGEVFVTDDGAETDLDLGHYERFTGNPASQARQHHHRPHLPGHPRQGAARRLSRRHHPGDPARHQRHQGLHPRRQRRRRFRADGDRRHGRRHREPAVPRSDPPVRQRTAAPARDLHPPHADAVHPERRRTEDQADPALGQGTALDRHPARHPAVPHRPRNPEGRAPQAVAVLQRARDRGDRGARRRQHLRGAGGLFGRGLRQRGAGRLRPRPRQAAGPGALAAHQRAHPQSGRPGHHRHRRQIHRHEGRLQIADRGAVARRHRQQGQGQSRLDRVRGVREGRPGAVPRTRQRHPGAGRLRPARRRGQDPRGAVRARAPRAVFRHLLRHADGGDRGGAQSAAASPRPTRPNSRRPRSRWSA